MMSKKNVFFFCLCRKLSFGKVDASHIRLHKQSCYLPTNDIILTSSGKYSANISFSLDFCK